MFSPVKTRKVYLEIVAQIKDIIEKGFLKPGDKLPSEMELTKQFDASRTAVREALAALEFSGIIETRRGAGNYIKDSMESSAFITILHELLYHTGPFELLEARKVIESGVVSLAIKKASPENIKSLDEILEEMPGAIENGTWNEVNTRFHFLIAEIAENTLLLENMKYIIENMQNFDFWRHMEKKSFEIPGRLQHFYKVSLSLFFGHRFVNIPWYFRFFHAYATRSSTNALYTAGVIQPKAA